MSLSLDHSHTLVINYFSLRHDCNTYFHDSQKINR